MKGYSPKGITPEVQANLDQLNSRSDAGIDLSDMPGITDWSGAVPGKFFRPVKQQVTLRLDADILHWFKTHGSGSGRGYQTRINAALRRFVEQAEGHEAAE